MKSSTTVPLLLGATLMLLAPVPAARGDQPHTIIDNFTRPLPSSGQLRCTVDDTQPKIGLAAARLAYTLDAQRKSAMLDLPDQARPVSGAGSIRLWVKGDGSPNELQLQLRYATPRTEPDGRMVFADARDINLAPFALAKTEWTEVTLDATAIPPGTVAWWDQITVRAPGRGDPVPAGTIFLDDARLYPASNPPVSSLVTGLIGPAMREFNPDIAVYLDARNFSGRPAQLKVRLGMSDRNDNLVCELDQQLQVGANEAREFTLRLAPDNLGAYLPPFRIQGDVLSTEVPSFSATIDSTIVMGNSYLLFDNMADIRGNWLAADYGALRNQGHWLDWLMSEAPRSTPWPQTAMRMTRVDVAPAAGATESAPPDRFAMRVDYTGDAAVYRGIGRYLPGNAYAAGVWVKGDGSGAKLSAAFLDFTDNADFWVGGWRRTRDGVRHVCDLDFTDWRYFEVPLPGNGLGNNGPRGSTEGIDFPIELSGFAILAATPTNSGSICIGPVFARTQQTAAETLAVMVGYDDPDRFYQAALGAWVSVQNSWMTGAREVDVDWTLTDRDNQPVASGRQSLTIPAREVRAFRVELAPLADKIAAVAAPLRLAVTAADRHDVSITAQRQLVLARPDSLAALTGFEAARGYLGLKADGITNAPAPGASAALTSTAQAHSGQRSLAVEWDRPARMTRFVSVDPPMPGMPVEISFWVYGDGSGALVYPLIGDRRGISHGLGLRQFDLFLPRTTEGKLQNAVALDFTGWKQLTFRLPVIPATWDTPLPILGFVPSYPLGLHLVVCADACAAEKGTVYFDDITVRTHLRPAERMALEIQPPDESNILSPGAPLQATVYNHDAAAGRKAVVQGGIYDWHGRSVANVSVAVEPGPGQVQAVPVTPGLPPGAYEIRLALLDGTNTLAEARRDVLVAGVADVLGTNWMQALRQEWRLRAPVYDHVTVIDEEWDWVEQQPGNIQFDSLRDRMGRARAEDGLPYVLLGYSAYWASGVGFEQMKSSSLVRPLRDIGHAIDTFMIPARMEDWEDYVLEMMRGAGGEVGGWVLWDNPDGSSSLAMRPEKLASLIALVDKWRRVYCPEVPLLIGGMGRETALPYLSELARHEALQHINGVNLRMDVGRLSPENARVVRYAASIRDVLAAGGTNAQSILMTDLDWAVEKGGGLDAFDQAAYLTRSDLLLSRYGIRPMLPMRNMDFERLGTGLAYLQKLTIPPLTEMLPTYQLKPAWWAVARMRGLLDGLSAPVIVDVADVIPGRTLAHVYGRKTDGKAVVIAWRNNTPGELTFAPTGLQVETAEDALGSPVIATNGWYAVGKLPVIFNLAQPAAGAERVLARLRVRDGAEAAWPQRVLAAFTPDAAAEYGYAQAQGVVTNLSGSTVDGDTEVRPAVLFAQGGGESFTVQVPAGSGIILRKRYLLDESGQVATVTLNGATPLAWNLQRLEKDLSGGLREAELVIDAAALGGNAAARIEVSYEGAANSIAWTVLEYVGGDFPLTAMGPIHAEQNVATPRLGCNVTGGALGVTTDKFDSGIGVFAKSLIEYPLNGQFKRFTARVGIDSITDGRGSVVFEVWTDGRKAWSSPIMSGLEQSAPVDVDVAGASRLRLVVTDAGDGNAYDAANWCDPVLSR